MPCERQRGPKSFNINAEDMKSRIRERHQRQRHAASCMAMAEARKQVCSNEQSRGWEYTSDQDAVPPRLSCEEWCDLMDETGCERSPEFLSYLIELEDEIRNDMMFDQYDSSRLDATWDEYFNALS